MLKEKVQTALIYQFQDDLDKNILTIVSSMGFDK